MASGEDFHANAEFIRLADEVVEVPCGANANNYANVEVIAQVAQQTSVDAVWPVRRRKRKKEKEKGQAGYG